MPTYTNTSTNDYQTPSGLLPAGAEGFESTVLLDYLDGVVQTSALPLFNLLRARHDLSFSAQGEEESAIMAAPELVATLLILPTVAVDMAINDATNVPKLRLLANKEYFLTPNGAISKLVFTATGAGEVVVEEVGPKTAGEANDGSPVTFGGEGVTFGGEAVTW